MPRTIYKGERAKPSIWEIFLDRLGLLTPSTLESLLSCRQLSPPASFVGRLPVFTRRVRDRSEMVLMSRPITPGANDTYAFHTIRFGGPYGFFWFGDYYDAGLQAANNVKQILAGKLLFVNVDGFNVRVYRTDWLQNPPVQYITTLNHPCQVVDMGTANSNLVTLVLEDGRIRHYTYVGEQDEPVLMSENDFIKQKGMRILSANVVTNQDILVETIDSQDKVALWHTSYQANLVGYYPLNCFSYPVIGKAPVGKHHVTLKWYGYPHENPCDSSIVFITGDTTSITVFAVVTGYFQLVKFKAANGSLFDHFSFPQTTFDWDMGFEGQAYDGNLKLLRATTEGLRVDTLKFQLSVTRDGGDGTFEVVSSVADDTLTEQRCAFWDSCIPARGHFSVALNGGLSWSL